MTQDNGHTAGLRRGYSDDFRIDLNGGRFNGGGSYVTLVDAKKQPIAVVLGRYIPGEIDPEMDAYARQFIAAPALLEALEDARQFAVCAIKAAIDLPDFDPTTHVLVRKIDAALLQARGSISPSPAGGEHE